MIYPSVHTATFGILQLIAHPQLNNIQRDAIEHEFRIEHRVLEVRMRLAQVFYFIRRNNLDLRDGQIDPVRAQLYLRNYDEVIRACELANAEGRKRVAERGTSHDPGRVPVR
jgi:hypothetical protein